MWGESRLWLPNRGGNWNNGFKAGVFQLNLNNERSNSNNSIGFRSALVHWPEVDDLLGYHPVLWNKGAFFPAEIPFGPSSKKYKLPGIQLVA